MATKKQRRRREKLQRHEYEYVVEDEEGEEVVVESPKAATQKKETGPPKVVDRRGRVVQKPTWQRVLKRSAIFAPILAILIWVTGSSLTTAGKIFNIVVLLAIFIPFSYLVDVLIYRSVQKRQQRESGGRPPSGRSR